MDNNDEWFAGLFKGLIGLSMLFGLGWIVITGLGIIWGIISFLAPYLLLPFLMIF